MSPEELTRRRLLATGAAIAATPLIAACGDDEEGEATTVATQLEPTPSCANGDEPTPEQTEGPFFIPDSPGRATIRDAATEGEALLVSGVVLGTDCKPIAGALLDFWQADGDGVYDLEGYNLRGNQKTDSRGRYRLETVRPGPYPGRTPHIHVIAQRPDGDVLITQLYFPGEPANAEDAIFDEALLVEFDRSGASFDFVLS